MSKIYDRRTTLGSSDIAKVIGISKWGDEWDVWLEKTGRSTPKEGFSGDQAGGNMMETAIAMEVGKRMNLSFVPGPDLSEAPSIGSEPWMSARVDFRGRVWKGRSWKCGLEVKTLRKFDETWGPDGSDLFPPDKAAQIAWQQTVDNSYPFTILAAYAWSSYELRLYKVKRSKSTEKALVDHCRSWWEDHVINDVPPEVTGSSACSNGLSTLFPAPERKVYRTATDVELRLVDAYRSLSDKVTVIQAERSEIGNLLKQCIGSDYGLKPQEGSPLVIYYKHGSSRRLRLLSQDDSE